MFTPSAYRASSAYKRVGVDTTVPGADSHRLVQMLFDEALESISAARGAMQRREIPAKCALIGKALRIVDEGLRASLNTDRGGELAGNLNSLYSYCVQKLMLANARNDEALLIEVRELLEPVAQAWRAISPAALAAQAADA
jgi:flagellar protein FliS